MGSQSSINTGVKKMKRPKIEIIGTRAVVSNIDKTNKRGREGAEEGLIAGGYLVMNDAKYLTPVDTGRLRASESVNWTGSGMNRGKYKPVKGSKPTDPVGRPRGMKDFVVVVGTNVEYGEHVHKRVPYLKAALYQNKKKIEMVLANAIKQKLKGAF